MKKSLFLLTAVALLGLVSCSTTSVSDTPGTPEEPKPLNPTESGDQPGEVETVPYISLSNAVPRLAIGESVTIVPNFENGAKAEQLTVSDYDETKFVIEQTGDENHSLEITMLASDVDADVTLTNSDGLSTTLRVRSQDEAYDPTSDDETWFDDITVSPLDSALKADTPVGLDVSFIKQNYDHGARYYNKDGVEENIFKIIKDAGYNTVRIKEFVDPYNYEIGEEKVTYGGGVNDLETNLWIAKMAANYDLDVMIDLHLSDFYADPSNQVIPKAWVDAETPEEMANYVDEYVTSTLTTYKENGINVSYVQIGNETTTGLFRHLPGEDVDELTGDNPGYLSGRRDAISSGISGAYPESDNFEKYMKEGVDAAKEVFPEIETIIHVARGFSATDFYVEYYNRLVEADVDFDIIGVSGYVYFQGRPNESELGNLLNVLNENFADKKVMIMETSYGYTFDSNPNASNSFGENNQSGQARPVSNYEVSPQGQANLMRDTLNIMNNHANGYGFMYWGGEFTPVAGSGWADEHTKSSWANQALFSYGGKALPSLYFLDQLN